MLFIDVTVEWDKIQIGNIGVLIGIDPHLSAIGRSKP
ncbi:MAG: hypothetical protein BWX77_01187 [Bacteroidetes bacterium ADurb.Bin090]|nr:MAG: hypothetical protein BWX77_01187 [Bacteroidetes bacterium ADurb.Bin090]